MDDVGTSQTSDSTNAGSVRLRDSTKVTRGHFFASRHVVGSVCALGARIPQKGSIVNMYLEVPTDDQLRRILYLIWKGGLSNLRIAAIVEVSHKSTVRMVRDNIATIAKRLGEDVVLAHELRKLVEAEMELTNQLAVMMAAGHTLTSAGRILEMTPAELSIAKERIARVAQQWTEETK